MYACMAPTNFHEKSGGHKVADKHEAEPGNVTPMSPQLETTHRRASLLTCETLGALFENKTSATQRAYFLSASEMRPSSSYVGGVEILKQATGNAGRSTQQPRPSGFVPTLKYQTHQEPANEFSMPCPEAKGKIRRGTPDGLHGSPYERPSSAVESVLDRATSTQIKACGWGA